MQDFRYPVEQYRVIDGDTIDVTLDQGFFTSTTQSCRIVGIDAPEIETAAGQVVRDCCELYLKTFALRDLRCRSIKLDKYCGRFVGDIDFPKGTGDFGSLAQWLVDRGLARPYSGNKKTVWQDSELLEICKRAEDLKGSLLSLA